MFALTRCNDPIYLRVLIERLRELPASDTLTIASKLLTAMVLIPLAFLAALILTHIVVGVIVSITLATAGGSPFSLLIAELRPLDLFQVVGPFDLGQGIDDGLGQLAADIIGSAGASVSDLRLLSRSCCMIDSLMRRPAINETTGNVRSMILR